MTHTYVLAAVVPTNRFFLFREHTGMVCTGNKLCRQITAVGTQSRAIKRGGTFHSLALGKEGVFQRAPQCGIREGLALCVSSLMRYGFI